MGIAAAAVVQLVPRSLIYLIEQTPLVSVLTGKSVVAIGISGTSISGLLRQMPLSVWLGHRWDKPRTVTAWES